MKNLISTIIIIFAAINLNAQIDNNLYYSSFFNLNSSSQSPAILGKNKAENFQLNLINLDLYTFSNIVSPLNIVDAVNEDFNFVGDLLNTNEDLFVTAGVDVQAFNFAFKTKVANQTFNFAFGGGNKFDLKTTFANELLKLITEGNGSETFRGKTVEMPITFNTTNLFEFNVGLATTFENLIPAINSLSIGANLNFLAPTIGLIAEDATFSIYTDEYGRQIDAAYNLNFLTSQNLEIESASQLSLINGGGFAIDLGAFAQISDKLSVDFNLLDLGKIKFNNKPASIKSDGNFSFTGVDIPDIFGTDASIDETQFGAIFDEFESNFKGFEAADNFEIAYPSRLRINATYQPIVKRKITKNNKIKTYKPHTLSATYINGFNERGLNTTNPYLAARYILNLKNTLELGGNLGFGGINNFEMGLLTAVRLGPLRVGFGSRNLFSGLTNKSTKVDFGFNISIAPMKFERVDTNAINGGFENPVLSKPNTTIKTDSIATPNAKLLKKQQKAEAKLLKAETKKLAKEKAEAEAKLKLQQPVLPKVETKQNATIPVINKPEVVKPTIETPKVEVPKVETSKVDEAKLLKQTQKAEAKRLKAEAKKLETTKKLAEKAEAKLKLQQPVLPKVETKPNTTTPVINKPEVVKPTIETPKLEVPKVETPKVDEAKLLKQTQKAEAKRLKAEAKKLSASKKAATKKLALEKAAKEKADAKLKMEIPKMETKPEIAEPVKEMTADEKRKMELERLKQIEADKRKAFEEKQKKQALENSKYFDGNKTNSNMPSKTQEKTVLPKVNTTIENPEVEVENKSGQSKLQLEFEAARQLKEAAKKEKLRLKAEKKAKKLAEKAKQAIQNIPQ